MTFKIENYTRTDNPDGSVTFTPVNVSKRFVPKMGEMFYIVTSDGGVEELTWINNIFDKGRLEMGNVYRTQAEAEKAHDKKLALVRIQNYIADNDLGKEFVEEEENYFLVYNFERKGFRWLSRASHEHYNPIGYLKSSVACTQVNENCKEDLLIVFGKV